MKSALKKIIPIALWQSARAGWLRFKDALVRLGPSERSRSYCGYMLYYNAGNSIIERLKREPVFEEDMCRQIVDDLKKPSGGMAGEATAATFMDIGANIGFISLYVASKLPDTRIFAFEPGPTQSGYLKRTVAANHLGSRIEVSTRALSDKAGTQTFYVHPRRDMAKDGLADTGRGEKTIPIEVQTMTVDEWWTKAGKPQISVVKIDTEGAELLILRGAREFLAAVKPTIYLEVEESNLKAYPYKAQDVFDFLKGAGYEYEAISSDTYRATKSESSGAADLVAAWGNV